MYKWCEIVPLLFGFVLIFFGIIFTITADCNKYDCPKLITFHKTQNFSCGDRFRCSSTINCYDKNNTQIETVCVEWNDELILPFIITGVCFLIFSIIIFFINIYKTSYNKINNETSVEIPKTELI